MIKYSPEQAFSVFIDKMQENIQSPEALRVEAQYRLDHLTTLLESGEWVQDEQGNVFPRSLSEPEQSGIAAQCAFSILDGLPVVIGNNIEATMMVVGSVISGATVIVEGPDVQLGTLKFSNALVVSSTFTLAAGGTYYA